MSTPNPGPIILVLASCLLCFALGAYVMRPRWNRRRVASKFRGPNADSEYPTIIVEDKEYWFTDEQLGVAEERAKKLSACQAGDPRNL